MKQLKIDNIYKKHSKEIREFLTDKINDNKISETRPDKLGINCPYCYDSRHRFKLVVNIDWGNFKCFRCGETGSISKLLKKLNIYNDFINLLSSFTNLSLFNIETLMKNNTVESNIGVLSESNSNKAVKEFIKSKGLISINKIICAKKYALERSYNNKEEIESYLCDEKYMYIPIIMNDQIVAYMARLYLETKEFPRYMFHMIDESSPMIGFFDQVMSNFSSDSLYITEGYFDAYAINYSFANYVSICSFGSNKVSSVVNELVKNFSEFTKIYLTLDSPNKDKNIYNHVFKFGDELRQYFPHLHVSILPDSDPSEILHEKGPMFLKDVLNKSSVSYLKYSIINRNKKK